MQKDLAKKLVLSQENENHFHKKEKKMPAYLKHATHERARFRHPALGREDKRQTAMEILKRSKGVVGIKPGVNSILIYFEPEAELSAMCADLEKALPELAAPEPEKMPERQKKTGQAVSGANGRKLELKWLLSSSVATVGLALLGAHHWHAVAGGIFTLFAARHVWERKARI